MGRDTPLLVSITIGALAGTLVLLLPVGTTSTPPERRVISAPAPVPPPFPPPGAGSGAYPAPVPTAPLPPPLSGGGPAAPPSRPLPVPAGSAELSAARRAQLIEAQDRALQRILANPADAEAFASLVWVRRVLAGQDPVTLRRQAAAYSQAIDRGLETADHYRPQVLRILIRACLTGALEIESDRRGP